jgi:hypothetical protein
MDQTFQTCNQDCIDKGSKTVVECFDKCVECVDTMSCWTDLGYGSTADTDCFDTCYESCDDFWATSSDLCTCDGHNTCIFGCPGKCNTATSFIACNVDCMGQETGPYDCLEYCGTCVTDNGCWDDAEYGSEEDVLCFTDCYTDCESNLGGESDLCACDGHTFCVLGCPENCTPPGTLYDCNFDCIANQGIAAAEACAEFCEGCVTTLGCWVDATYGDAADQTCYTECYS